MHKLLALMLPVAVLGCGNSYLTYRALPPAPSLAGKVAIEVRDNRALASGTTPDEIGAETKVLIPVPRPIRLHAPEDVPGTVATLLGAAAKAAGVDVASGAADATSKLVVEVQRFWCSGYDPVYKAEVFLSLTVTDPSGTQVRVPGQPLLGQADGMRCQGTFEKALTQLFTNAKAMLAKEPIKTATLTGPASTASAAPNDRAK